MPKRNDVPKRCMFPAMEDSPSSTVRSAGARSRWRPTLKSTLILVGAGIVLFFVSPIGQGAGRSPYWADGPSWLGAIGWFGLMAVVLLLIVSGFWAAIARIMRR
jgi:hypothetical protein